MDKCKACGNDMVCMSCATTGATSSAKARAARKNGKKGGRPKGSRNKDQNQ